MRHPVVASAAALAAALALAQTATAAVVTFTDAAAFSAALGSPTLEDFSDATLAAGLTVFTCGDCSIADGVFNDRVRPGVITRFRFDEPVHGFGGVFDLRAGNFGQNLGVGYVAGPRIVNLPVEIVQYTGQFFGFISDEPFTTVRIFAGTGPGVAETYTLDDVRFGVLAPNAAVPEPRAWALMITGFGLTAAALRSRRRLLNPRPAC